MDTYRVMSVGDGASGRTCSLIVFSHGMFPETYIPVNADSFAKEIRLSDHTVVRVGATEDDGVGEDYYVLRPHKYPSQDIFLALFSVASRASFNHVEEHWIPELRHHCPDTPIIIVANQIDLRGNERYADIISTKEGLKLAKKMGTSYHEISALQMKGVEECYQFAAEIVHLNKKRPKNSPVFLAPIRKWPEPVPAVEPAVSSFINDWGQTITNPKFSDVKFIVQGGRSILAHKVVLCSASPFFEKILLSKSYGKDDIVSGKVQGFHSISEGDDGEETTVELSEDVKAETFDKILEFLYTGSLSGNIKVVDISDLKRTAQMFEMNQLDVECDGVERYDFTLEDVLKPMTMREYLKQDTFSDVVFNVNGTLIPAHNVVIYTRCPKIAEALESTSVEGKNIKELQITDTSVENFTLFLDYLYTDFPDVDTSSDLIGLIKLANKYGAHRLVTLCEVKLPVHPLDETNAIELLHKYKEYETPQLVALCLHCISHNYTLISSREEFSTLNAHDRKYVKDHRWPSASYERERDEFYREYHAGCFIGKRRCIIA